MAIVLVVHFVYHREITVNHGRFDGTCAGLSRLCLRRPRALNERSGFAEASLARAASSGQAELGCRPVGLKLMEPRNWMVWHFLVILVYNTFTQSIQIGVHVCANK